MPSRSMFDSSLLGVEPLCILALRMCLWVIAVQSPTDESNYRDQWSGQEAAVPVAFYSLLSGGWLPPLTSPLAKKSDAMSHWNRRSPLPRQETRPEKPSA